jgi:Ca2+-binding EF-hand superfamily protein
MMVGTNLNRTIIKADKDYDGKISFEEFKVVRKSIKNI